MSSRTQAAIRRARAIKKLNTQIAAAQKKMESLKREKTKLEAEGIEFLLKDGVDSIRSGRMTVSLSERDVPTIQDFDKFWTYVRRNNLPELIHRRVSSDAWREREQKVPGIGTFTKRSLSITTK